MHHFDERKTERVWLILGPAFKRRLEERARQDRRKLAEWICRRLEDALEAEGPPPEPRPRGR